VSIVPARPWPSTNRLKFFSTRGIWAMGQSSMGRWVDQTNRSVT
jgi:hypothetical protein